MTPVDSIEKIITRYAMRVEEHDLSCYVDQYSLPLVVKELSELISQQRASAVEETVDYIFQARSRNEWCSDNVISSVNTKYLFLRLFEQFKKESV